MSMRRSYIQCVIIYNRGRRSMDGQGDMSPPLLFEVEGTPCVLSPLLYGGGVDIFCTNAELHSTDYIYMSQFSLKLLPPDVRF